MLQALVGLLLTGPISILSVALFASHRFDVSTALQAELWVTAFGAAFGWLLPGTAEIWRPLFGRLPLIGKKL